MFVGRLKKEERTERWMRKRGCDGGFKEGRRSKIEAKGSRTGG